MRKPTKAQIATHERMKAELRIRGTSLAKLARELGVSDSALTLVGKRMTKSNRIEKALANALGVEQADLFPPEADGKTRKPHLAPGTQLVENIEDVPIFDD